MTDSRSHFYIKLEEERERITNNIRTLENEAINSQKETHERFKELHKTL